MNFPIPAPILARAHARTPIEPLEARIAPAGVVDFAGTGAVIIDLAAQTITDSSAPGSPVDFTGAEIVQIGAGAALTIRGTTGPDGLTFTPAGATAGEVTVEGAGPRIEFAGITGAFTIDALGGGDVVTILGTSADNSILARGGATPTVQVAATKALTLVAAHTARLVVEALGGDDTLTVESEAGAFPVPIAYHGGNGFDILQTQGGAATENVYQLGMTPDAGVRTLVIGGVTQSITFTGLEPVLDTVAGPLTVNGNNANNSITYRQIGVNGLVAVDDSETIEFSNKTSLTINGFGGDDTISLGNPLTPTGLTVISVNGGDPAGNDTLIVQGTSGANAFTYTPSTIVGSGTVATTGLPSVLFATIEGLTIDGQGGGDTLNYANSTGRRVTYTPGHAPDEGTITTAGFGAGTGVVPLSFDHLGALGSITFNGSGDILEINGTANSDTFNVTGTTVQIINATAGFASVLLKPVNIFETELRGLEGNDTFNITGALAAGTGSLLIDGGGTSESDTLNLNSALGAVNVTLGTAPFVSGYGSTLTFLGIELLNANAGSNNATFTATGGDDEVAVRPTGTDAVTFALNSSYPSVGATPTVNFSNVGTMTVAGGGGIDSLVLQGTAAGDVFNLSRTVGALSLALQGRQAISPTNTFASWQVLGGGGADRSFINESGPITSGIALVLDRGGSFGTPGASDAFGTAHLYDPTLFTSGGKLVPGKGPTAVAAGDLDGDGFADLVVVNAKTSNLSLLINKGDGTFFDPINLATGAAGPQDLVLGDFDGDTFLDAVITFPKAGSFGFYKGDGAGNFATPVLTPIQKFKPFALAAADLDGDTDLDLAITSRDTGAVAVALNNGAATFTPGTPVKIVGKQPVDIVIADFNGDGDADLATANAGSNNINLFRGNGLGGLGTPVRFAAGVRPSALAAGDLDGDGDVDLAVSNAGSRFVSVLRSAGNVVEASQFTPQLRVALPGPRQTAAIAIADFDRDGLADLGIGNGLGTKFTVLRGLGAATYSQPYDFDLGKDLKPNVTSAFALADLNKDGLLDVVTTSLTTSDIRTLLSKV